MPKRTVILALALALVAPATASSTTARSARSGSAAARMSGSTIALTNRSVTRTWTTDRLRTIAIAGPGVSLVAPRHDFSLDIDGARITSDLLPVNAIDVAAADGRARVTWSLGAPAGLTVERTVEVEEGIDGFTARTTIRSAVPVILSGHTLDEVEVGAGTRATLHAFRAGADWRFDAGWNPVSIGDPRKGDWRVSSTGGPGQPVTGTAQWVSAPASGGRVAIVSERRDYASSVAGYDGAAISAGVDLSRDVVYFGPLEENAHAENPTPLPARHRVVHGELALEPSFTAVARDEDGEAWAFWKELRRRTGPIATPVIFNTDKVDRNAISTGAKDDVDFARFLKLADAAEQMGVDLFVFDGWQAASGDWCADSATCPEPRHPKFPHRFPDERFAAVKEVLEAKGMDLGLWFTPMEFHPASRAYRTNPQWACQPVGTGTAALSIVQPDSSSNEAGLGVWNPLAVGVHPDDPTRTLRLIDYIEERIERAIGWGAGYFKFDFLVWLDCAGAHPVTMYEYRDAFVDMVDRLRARHPSVLFTIDETNDYRMFPFESVARGATWFQNGTPAASQLLHNLWNLAPYVPGPALGQAALGNSTERSTLGIDTLMAVALGSHLTFWTEIDTALTAAQRAQVKRWTDFYRAHASRLTSMAFPLLDDPSSKGWTALQPWNADKRAGFVLAYRQADARAGVTVPLRGLGAVPDETVFTVTRLDPALATPVISTTAYTAAQLRAGLAVDAALNRYAIYSIEPA